MIKKRSLMALTMVSAMMISSFAWAGEAETEAMSEAAAPAAAADRANIVYATSTFGQKARSSPPPLMIWKWLI